jgi:hypothetical protein
MTVKLAHGVSIFAAVFISATEHVGFREAMQAWNETGAACAPPPAPPPALPPAASLPLFVPQAGRVASNVAVSAKAFEVFMAFASRSSDMARYRGRQGASTSDRAKFCALRVIGFFFGMHGAHPIGSLIETSNRLPIPDIRASALRRCTSTESLDDVALGPIF